MSDNNVSYTIEEIASLLKVSKLTVYDLILLKNETNEDNIRKIKEILSSEEIRNELNSMGDYDISETGKVIFETY